MHRLCHGRADPDHYGREFASEDRFIGAVAVAFLIGKALRVRLAWGLSVEAPRAVDHPIR